MLLASLRKPGDSFTVRLSFILRRNTGTSSHVMAPTLCRRRKTHLCTWCWSVLLVILVLRYESALGLQ